MTWMPIATLSLAQTSNSSTNHLALGYQYLSPEPGAEFVLPQTQFILVRFAEISPSDLTNLSTFIQTTGSVSGLLAGQTRIATDNRTVIFQLDHEFAPNEIVMVSLQPGLPPESGMQIEPLQYQFHVATTITAHGENSPNESKEYAFDHNLQTRWRDSIIPDGGTNFSWIQYIYPGDETHVVNCYAITCAGDAPERDPQDWRFYGMDSTTTLTLLDSRTNETFSGRLLQQTYTFTNTAAYRGYRLEITRVNDPLLADSVQLAELQLMEPNGSILREYWTGIPGPELGQLTSCTNYPAYPNGSDLLTTFEAPNDLTDDFGTRIRGYITPPILGYYTFWISGGDSCELWLSPDAMPANASRIAYANAATASHEWNKFDSQSSISIILRPGRKYYIEALQKVAKGRENLAVGWAKPDQGLSVPSEIVPGAVLSPWKEPMPTPSGNTNTTAKTQATVQTVIQTISSATVLPNGVSIPGDFPQRQISVNLHPAPGYIFLENIGQGSFLYTMMLDNNGYPVWYRRSGGRDFKVQNNGTITWSAFTGVDKNFNFIGNYYASNGYDTDEHDLKMLPNGGYLLIGYRDQGGIDMSRYLPGGNPCATIHATALQEFTAAGELILQFSAWDHFEIRDVDPVVENPLAAHVRFPHMNSVEVDSDGHLLLSSRHLSEVTKINRQTGQVIWRLNGAHNEFTFVNDPLNGFYNQHDITALGNNRYLLFDNGNSHSPSLSRAVEYQLDLTNRTATLVWQFRNTPDSFASSRGSAQRLLNGNTLINFVQPNNPKVVEVDPEGVKQFELNLTPGYQLYRSFRFPWDGVVSAPYLIAEAYPDYVTLIFNKFGDHNVDHYCIYGGTNQAPTNLIATSRTTLKRIRNVINSKRNYFRVTAVSSNGVESACSNEESLLVNITRPGENMVLNGEFAADANTWNFAVSAAADAGWQITNGTACASIANAGTQLTDVSLRQAGLKLIQGREYILEFDAWAPLSRSMEVRLGQDQSPWTPYKIVSPSLTPAQHHFSYSLVMTNISDLNVRLTFNLGASSRDVYLDNISVWMVAQGDFNRDRRVDYLDLAIFTGQWLQKGTGLSADLNGDGTVDFKDYEIFSENWSGGR